MKTIDRKIVKQYWRDHYGIYWWVVPGILLLFLGLTIFGFADSNGRATMWGFGWLPLLLGTLMIGRGFMSTSHELDRRDTLWQYQLLDRWKRHSGQPLSMFPSSTIGSKFLRTWAMEELTKRAQELNECYSREDIFYAEEDEIDWVNMDPRDGEDMREERVGREEWMKAHIQNKKRSFLDLWDLVTERDGIGILTGPEWRDPEAFRKKVLAAGNPYIRIGFLHY